MNEREIQEECARYQVLYLFAFVMAIIMDGSISGALLLLCVSQTSALLMLNIIYWRRR
jgi:hypothetical protein